MFPDSTLLPVPQDVLTRMENDLKLHNKKPYVHCTREEADLIKAEMQSLFILEKEAESIISRTLAEGMSNLCGTVSGLTNEKFVINCNEGDFSFGYIRNEYVPFEVLSGAERAICASALACALANKLKEKNEVSLVLVDDVWLDKDSSVKITDMLRSAVDLCLIDQAIVTMVNGGDGEDGWKKVDL